MYIKQVILDGFKSYASRTVVSDFDPQFNAITGLNGSGKSNILDAICFVLGITQLNQVRVSSLQGLVYKHGQSGVTKASVAIVFDNSDSKSSPVGYEHEKEITVIRQVVIGGRNKYMINGHTATASTVQNLFHSVQLNVNNPHFLIMQGRITKVLNMKPPEILGMIEEAAGTSMYERKKADAEKKMSQKAGKVNEIEKILAEEITPKLEKLRAEKQQYLKWSAQNTEAERLERFVVAHQFTRRQEIVEVNETKYNELAVQVQTLEEEVEKLREEKADIKKRERHFDSSLMKKLEKKIDKLTAKEDEISKALVKQQSVLSNQDSNHQKLIKKRDDLQSKIAKWTQEEATLQEQSKEQQLLVDKFQAEYDASKKQYDNAQIGLQAANAGLDSTAAADEDAAEQRTLEETLVALRTAAGEAATTLKQNEMKLKHIKKELKTIKQKVKTTSEQDAKIMEELETYKSTTTQLEQELSALDYSPEEAQRLQAELEVDQGKLEQAKDIADEIGAELTAFDFAFSSPSGNFDRSKVKGMVAKLVTVSDLANATALEVVAGGKLYQVVVDTVATGKVLLEKGKLQKRVTIIPLDKVSTRTIPANKLEAAERVAGGVGGTAKSALRLVGYDQDISRAMEYVFGTTLVCDSLNTARTVTFDKQVRVRSVTLEGDSFDPQGTLSGGSRPSHGSVLIQLNKLQRAQAEVEKLQKSINEKSAKLSGWRAAAKTYQVCSQKLDLARHELKLVEERSQQTPYAQLVQKQTDLEQTLKNLEEGSKLAQVTQKESLEKAKKVETDMEDMEAARVKLVSNAQTVLKKAKIALEKADSEFTTRRDKFESIALELEQVGVEKSQAETVLEETETGIRNGEKELVEIRSIVDTRKSELEIAQSDTNGVREELEKCVADLSSMSKATTECMERIANLEVKIHEFETDQKYCKKNAKEASRDAKALCTKYPWIASEAQFFGKPHTDYDFEAKSPAEATVRLRELHEAQSKFSGSVNKKVMGMIGKAEQEYEDLNRKRAIIEKDRQTIERVIKGLDTKKNEAVRATWEKVNKDFGSIFSTLLPGTNAKLDPAEGGTIYEGLEVKVAFGKTWKKSLTELSGGQRSLLALSLILALLLFKPAPMYILDEVDAALDLSHTQNIGQMLRTHFAHSQFIVVSLKEGMFNNANVIFRTKFIDGVSTVARSSNKDHVQKLLQAENKKQHASKKRQRNQNQNVPVNV